jgi:pseudouridylate synthase
VSARGDDPPEPPAVSARGDDPPEPPAMLAEEVAEALRAGRPVVALETTLVSHGFSAGRGLAAAQAAEARVRAAGAVPATIGIVDGTLRAGLGHAELQRFAEAGPQARKVGARDIAACIVQGALGATTVGGTLAVCRALGIRFLGTGGIGGVHRGFADTLDISGDLLQIARTPAVVVSSGAKSILDVSATAELLETLGVPVLGWQTATLPLFYTADGGPAVPAVVTTSGEAARIALTHWRLSPSSGLLLARPPAGGLDLEPIVAEAVRQVQRDGVTGQAVTPAVLTLVEELSGGRSVEVNQRLIADNAALAAEVAVAWTELAR